MSLVHVFNNLSDGLLSDHNAWPTGLYSYNTTQHNTTSCVARHNHRALLKNNALHGRPKCSQCAGTWVKM